MHTISDIIEDINRGCTANNMAEDKYFYRIIFFVKEGNQKTKHSVKTAYGDLRKSLEYIIRSYLSLTNNIIIEETTSFKDGECVSLQSRPYSFSLDGYFKQINEKWKNRNTPYKKYAVR